MQIDEIDRKILDVLQKNGRISNKNLADRVGLSPSPCLRRVKMLEEIGVIQSYVALLNPIAVEQGLQAFIEVRLRQETGDAVAVFEREIMKYPQVLECYLMAGDWDYILRVGARDLENFREFCMNALVNIPSVGNVKSNICMKQVKYSTALPIKI